MKDLRTVLPALCAAAMAALASSPASATLHEVASLAELRTRLALAVPGDTIVLRDGVYRVDEVIAIGRRGSATAPIVIRARTPGAARFTGREGFDVRATAAHVEITGFDFAQDAGTVRVEPGAVHIRFSRNVFHCGGEGAYLTIAGDSTVVDHNEFRDKGTVGNMIDVRGAGSQVARHVWIHHNYFHDFSSAGANGAETIRFGLSGLSMSNGDGLIEHNLFLRCTGENELISVKSGSNTLRFNTFLDSPGAQLTLRHGNENLVYGNYFRGTDGIRIFGDRHRVFSNYLEGNTGGINLGNGDGEVADGAKLTSHDRPDDAVIAFNTLVNNARNFYMTPRKNGLGATRTVFADNVIVGGGAAARLEGPDPGGVWSANLLWRTDGAGDMPATGFDALDPKLTRGAGGMLRPGPGSPAVDSARGDYPAIVVDVDGQPRSSTKDRGADELSRAPVLFVPLTADDGRRLIQEGS